MLYASAHRHSNQCVGRLVTFFLCVQNPTKADEIYEAGSLAVVYR